MERKFGWLAFPGLIRSIALLQAAFFVLLAIHPNAMEHVAPSWDKVLEGEIWRLVAFTFFPPLHPQPNIVFSGLFMFFAVNILFLISDSLESHWGTFRTSIYVYATIICQSLAQHAFASSPHLVFYSALFFAFATLFPKVEFRLMLIIPVKVWLLASFTGVIYFLTAIAAPYPIDALATTCLSFLPYLAWALPNLYRWKKTRGQVQARRSQFEGAKQATQSTLHFCKVCHRTEVSHPELEFRVAEDEHEYCLDHLPPSSHSPS